MTAAPIRYGVFDEVVTDSFIVNTDSRDCTELAEANNTTTYDDVGTCKIVVRAERQESILTSTEADVEGKKMGRSIY